MGMIAKIKQRYGWIEVGTHADGVTVLVTDDDGKPSPNRAELTPAQSETFETAIRTARRSIV
jgi:hypothetical protein